jgi:hypothetical protein
MRKSNNFETFFTFKTINTISIQYNEPKNIRNNFLKVIQYQQGTFKESHLESNE